MGSEESRGEERRVRVWQGKNVHSLVLEIVLVRLGFAECESSSEAVGSQLTLRAGGFLQAL